MRILHVIDQISQRHGGGASQVAYKLAGAQATSGHDVTIYSTDYHADGQEPPAGVNMVKFRCWLDLFGSMRIAPGLLLARYDYDIAHFHNYRTLVNIFAALRAKRFVLQAHGSCHPIATPGRFIHNLVWGGIILKRANRLIADADTERGHYLTEGGEVERIKLIPVGIDLGDYKNLPQRKAGGNKTVLFLGRLHYIKGCDLLIDAMQYMRGDVELIIAGIDYGEEGRLRQQVDSLGLGSRVKFAGPLFDDAKLKALTDADVCVMPSRYEMWGIVFMEALACGTPVVMTDTCEASRYLLPECGRVSRLNAVDLAQTIQAVLGEDLADKYRQYRRKWVSQFSWDKIARRTIELYEEVLSG